MDFVPVDDGFIAEDEILDGTPLFHGLGKLDDFSVPLGVKFKSEQRFHGDPPFEPGVNHDICDRELFS